MCDQLPYEAIKEALVEEGTSGVVMHLAEAIAAYGKEQKAAGEHVTAAYLMQYARKLLDFAENN